MTSILPLQQGLFEAADGGSQRLIANRCSHCQRVFFPRRAYCGVCGATGLQDLRLAGRGKVYSFSIIDRKSKVSVIDPPYVQAEVAMPEGVHVFTVLDHCKTADVRIAMEVEMYVDEVPAPGGAGKVLAYKFRPIASVGGAA